MPQLDPSSFSSQLFWLTISFILLYVLLGRMLLPRVQSVLTTRSDTIGGDLEQARKMKADAELAREHYEKALTHARQRSQAMLSEAQAELSARAAKQQAALDTQIEAKLAQSQQAIDAATRDAKAKLVAVAGELTVAVTQAVAQFTPDARAAEAAVASVIKGQGA